MTSPTQHHDARVDALRTLLMDTVASTSRRRAPRVVFRRAPSIVAGALVLALGLVVFPLATHTPRPDVAVPLTSTEATEAPLPGPSGGFTADAYFYASPEELANTVPLVFRGTVRGITIGSEESGITESAQFGETPLLVLGDMKVSKGALDLRDDETVLFALAGYHVGSDWSSLAEIALLFPEGTEIVAYARPGWLADNSGGVSNGPPANPARPITTPASLYASFHPQGLIVRRPGSSYLHWPYLNTARQGTLTDTLPDGDFIGTN